MHSSLEINFCHFPSRYIRSFDRFNLIPMFYFYLIFFFCTLVQVVVFFSNTLRILQTETLLLRLHSPLTFLAVHFVLPTETLTVFLLSLFSNFCDLPLFSALKTFPVAARDFWMVLSSFLGILSCFGNSR